MKTLFRSLHLIFQSHPVLSIFFLIVIILHGLIPSLLVFSSRNLIDAVSEFFGGGAQSSGMLFGSTLHWAALFFLNALMGILYDLMSIVIERSLMHEMNLRLIVKAASFKDLHNLENPDFNDDVHMLQNQASSRCCIDLLTQLPMMMRSLIILVGMFIVLSRIHYLIPTVLVVTSIPHLLIAHRMSKVEWDADLKTARNARLSEYFKTILLDVEFLKESIFYKLGNLAREKYEENDNIVIQEKNRAFLKETFIMIPALLAGVAGSVWSLFFVVLRGGGSLSSAGVLAMFFQAFLQVQSNLRESLFLGRELRIILLHYNKFFRFMHWENKIVLKDGPLPTQPPISSEPPIVPQPPISSEPPTAPGQPASPSPIPLIEFRNVSFRYPGSPLPALRNISFRLHQGQTLALVGKNGSGKSTIIKLLLRFYDPTSGSITCLGKPIEDIVLDKWRSTLSCVFQDFARFRLPLVDSVALANQDIPPDIPRITRIFQAMDFTEHIAFSEGREEKGREGKKDREGGKNQEARLQNISLGKEFDGLEPSGGQWQKIAIARALYRNADIVIMDEPTASLDPLAEARIFADFQQLATGKTSIMVTHRLGSTQSADKIIVLNEGSLVEEGTHPQLMAQPTLYAQMYATQQNQYSGGTGGTGGT